MPHPNPQPGDLLTTTEAAAVLQVSANTVRDWADSGALAGVRTPGGHRRFRRSDVDALLAPSAPTGEPTDA